jgi:hypothetical protein
VHANFALDDNLHYWTYLPLIQANSQHRPLRTTYFEGRNWNETREKPWKSRCFVSAWETETISLPSRPVSWEMKQLCRVFPRFLVHSGAPPGNNPWKVRVSFVPIFRVSTSSLSRTTNRRHTPAIQSLSPVARRRQASTTTANLHLKGTPKISPKLSTSPLRVLRGFYCSVNNTRDANTYISSMMSARLSWWRKSNTDTTSDYWIEIYIKISAGATEISVRERYHDLSAPALL